MRELQNLQTAPLFDLNQIDLFSFLNANNEAFAYKASKVLVEGKEVILANIQQENFLIGFADLSDGRYVMTASDNGFTQSIHFYRIEGGWVSAQNQMIGGGIYGVYHHTQSHPMLKPILDSMIKPRLVA